MTRPLARQTEMIDVSIIDIDARRRPVDEGAVERLAASIKEIGMRTPISIQYHPDRASPRGTDDSVVLISGAHRLAAAKRLGWSQIECFVFADCDEIDAQLWEIAENLHRCELTALQRDEQIALWVKLNEQRVSDRLSETSKGGRPGASAAASRELGVNERTVQRSVKVAGLSEEAKEAAREVGLDDNRTALLDAASKPSVAEQVAAIHQRAMAKPVKLADDPLNDFEAKEKQVAALMSAWNRASPEAREEFMGRIDTMVMDRRHG